MALQFAGPAAAQAFSSSEPCVVRTLPSEFVESSTTGAVADVVEVSCEPSLAGSPVRISEQELWSRCDHHASWVQPYPYEVIPSEVAHVTLDRDGNATVAVFAETCAAGESLVAAHLEDEPFYTAVTGFDVLAPKEAPNGEGVISVMPRSEVPIFDLEGVAAVAQVAFEPVFANQHVTVKSNELYSACGGHLVWVGPGGAVLGSGTPSAEVQLDYDGRAFVVALGGECLASEVLFSAKLEVPPFSTITKPFTIEETPPGSPGPKVTALEPFRGPQSGGNTTIITGEKLAGATQVRFGSTEATSFKVLSESAIEAVVPPGTGGVVVTVTTPEGRSQRTNSSAYVYVQSPKMSRIAPKHGPPAGGTLVTITGRGFMRGETIVRFGSSEAANVEVESETKLTATSPAGSGRVRVTVTTPGGTAPQKHKFTYR